MKPFWSIFKLNFVRTMNTWMIKFLFAVCLIGIALGCFLLNRAGESEKTIVCVQGRSQFYTDSFYEQLEKSGYQVINNKEQPWDVMVELKQIEGKENVTFYYEKQEQTDQALEQIFQNFYTTILMGTYQVEPLQIQKVYEMENEDDVFNVFMVTTIIIYLFIIVCGGAITSSVAMERISKVSELLTYRVSTLSIIYAKILALFASIATIVVAAAIEILVIKRAGFVPQQIEEILSMFQGIHMESILFLIGDACMGIYLYTLIYTMVGMTITSAEQLQYAQLPATIVLFISYGVGFYSCFAPNSMFVKIAFIIPIFTPFVAPASILGQNVTGVLIGLSGIINILFIVICNLIIMKCFVPDRTGCVKLRKAGI